jgi:AraC-like DNA-binding protein
MRTYSCAHYQALGLLGAWCITGGHWQVKNHALKPRIIDETVLIACLEGTGWLEIGGQQLAIKAGDLFCCPANVPHAYGCGPDGWTILWVHCQGSQVANFCAAAGLSTTAPCCPIARHPQVQAAFSDLIGAMANGDADSPWLAARNLHLLLHTLVWLRHKPDLTSNLASLVREGCETLDELVKASGYSKFHFCRRFKQETGQSPWQYVTNRKMERARELLLGSQASIKEIATRLGFNNPDYFARIFSKHSGVTPRHYRGRGKK